MERQGTETLELTLGREEVLELRKTRTWKQSTKQVEIVKITMIEKLKDVTFESHDSRKKDQIIRESYLHELRYKVPSSPPEISKTRLEIVVYKQKEQTEIMEDKKIVLETEEQEEPKTRQEAQTIAVTYTKLILLQEPLEVTTGQNLPTILSLTIEPNQGTIHYLRNKTPAKRKFSSILRLNLGKFKLELEEKHQNHVTSTDTLEVLNHSTRELRIESTAMTRENISELERWNQRTRIHLQLTKGVQRTLKYVIDTQQGGSSRKTQIRDGQYTELENALEETRRKAMELLAEKEEENEPQGTQKLLELVELIEEKQAEVRKEIRERRVSNVVHHQGYRTVNLAIAVDNICGPLELPKLRERLEQPLQLFRTQLSTTSLTDFALLFKENSTDATTTLLLTGSNLHRKMSITNTVNAKSNRKDIKKDRFYLVNPLDPSIFTYAKSCTNDKSMLLDTISSNLVRLTEIPRQDAAHEDLELAVPMSDNEELTQTWLNTHRKDQPGLQRTESSDEDYEEIEREERGKREATRTHDQYSSGSSNRRDPRLRRNKEPEVRTTPTDRDRSLHRSQHDPPEKK